MQLHMEIYLMLWKFSQSCSGFLKFSLSHHLNSMLGIDEKDDAGDELTSEIDDGVQDPHP
jgi:hypothetical protein